MAITREHLKPRQLRHATVEAFLVRQPTTVGGALGIQGCGYETASYLMELGLITDPEGILGGSVPNQQEREMVIREEHLRGLPGLRRESIAAVVAAQPRTVVEARMIPGVGYKTTRHLLELALITDPEGRQPGWQPAPTRRSRSG
jgi:hypothetical protein